MGAADRPGESGPWRSREVSATATLSWIIALSVVTLSAVVTIWIWGGEDVIARRVNAVGLLFTSLGLILSIFLKSNPKLQTVLGISAGIIGLLCIGVPYWFPGDADQPAGPTQCECVSVEELDSAVE